MLTPLLIAILLASEPAGQADGTMTAPLVSSTETLRMGQSMTVTFANGEQAVRSQGSAAAERPWTGQDAVALSGMTGPSAMDTLNGASPTSSPTQPSNAIRFTLVNPVGRNVVLMIDNGTAQRVRYTAEMQLSDGRLLHTNVCDAPAGHTFYEHWSDPIVALQIHVESASVEIGDAPYCEPPTAGSQDGTPLRT